VYPSIEIVEGEIMANRRMTLSKLKELIKLYEKNLSKSQIANVLGISRPTLYNYLCVIDKLSIKYCDVCNMSDSEVKELFNFDKKIITDRYLILTQKFPYILQELSKTGVTLMLLWEEYVRENPTGYRYSQFCELFNQWRKCEKELSMHMDHKPGDKMFVDFAGKKFVIIDKISGKHKEVQTFIAILGASELTYAEAVPDQKSETFVKANENAFRYFGGVTCAIVPDCLKSGVIKGDKYEPCINPLYKDFADHYGTIILPARPHHPKDKPLVENAVRLAYQRIYAPLRNMVFHSIAQLNRAIKEHLEMHNNKQMQKLDVSRRDLFNSTEKNCLKNLPDKRFEIKKYLSLKVAFNYHVEIREDKHYYSVPFKYRGRQVKVILSVDNVEILHENVRIGLYSRIKEPGYTTKNEHMPSHHKFYSGWNPERFISWASSIGHDVKALITKILEARTYPEQSYKVCLGIINLSKKYGNERLNNACSRALTFGCVSYQSVKSILEKGLDKQEEINLFNRKLPEHENIRGNQYYSNRSVK
jgi:transposase